MFPGVFVLLLKNIIMADFSKEYQNKYYPGMGWDFSILSIFDNLKEGEIYPEICEGYGFNAISRENGKCILIYSNGEKVEFRQLDSYIREKGWIPDN